MYFKVLNGTALYGTLYDVFLKVKAAKDYCDELAKEVGADGFSTSNSYIAGDINAFHFKGYEPPDRELWSAPTREKRTPWWMPKIGKKFLEKNEVILGKLKDIPRVDKKLIQDPLNCNMAAYGSAAGLTVFEVPATKWFKDYVLLEFPDQVNYESVPDMIEILASEHKELSKAEPLSFSS